MYSPWLLCFTLSPFFFLSFFFLSFSFEEKPSTFVPSSFLFYSLPPSLCPSIYPSIHPSRWAIYRFIGYRPCLFYLAIHFILFFSLIYSFLFPFFLFSFFPFLLCLSFSTFFTFFFVSKMDKGNGMRLMRWNEMIWNEIDEMEMR